MSEGEIMNTYNAYQMQTAWDEGFREGIIQGRIRQERESNAAMHSSYKDGYAAALAAVLDAAQSLSGDTPDQVLDK